MTNQIRVAMTKWMLLFAKLPKDHPQYAEQQELQAMVIGAGFGGATIGILIGFILFGVF